MHNSVGVERLLNKSTLIENQLYFSAVRQRKGENA